MPRTEQKSRRRLGRGLGSLLGSAVPVEVPASEVAKKEPATHSAMSPAEFGTPVPATAVEEPVSVETSSASVSRETVAEAELTGTQVRLLPVGKIRPNQHQPRQAFDEQALEQLAASIRENGVMQPILVRPSSSGSFELIAGERRWRAAQRVPLERIPAIVREVDDQTAAEWALIENLQREDLNPIERAEAFRQLVDRFGLTHQTLAERVGLDRSSVSNLLRLNDLDAESKAAVRSGALGLGHARSLLVITNKEARQALCREAVRRQWSVRELERKVRALNSATLESRASGNGSSTAGVNAHLADLEKQLSAHLGTRVQVVRGKKKGSGKLMIEFYDLDQFEGIMSRLGYKNE